MSGVVPEFLQDGDKWKFWVSGSAPWKWRRESLRATRYMTDPGAYRLRSIA